MNREKIKICVICIAMAFLCVCYGCSRFYGGGKAEDFMEDRGFIALEEPGEPFLEHETSDHATASKEDADRAVEESWAAEKESQAAESESRVYFYVHICGEVVNPGVYRMEEGSRFFQVVEAAGGFTDQAAQAYINLAQVASDGMKIVVPSFEEVEKESLLSADVIKNGGVVSSLSKQPDSSGNGAKEKVNINTAGKEQLMTLRGIGEARAEDIIRYRNDHGPFKTIEEIMNISGIKDAAFQKIKDDISV